MLPAQLTVEFSQQGQYLSTLENLLTLFLVMLALIMIAMVPALRFSRQLTQPIGDMVSAVQRIRDGDLSMAIHTRAKGELSELETALRQMVAALADAQTELQQNVDQATQDLARDLGNHRDPEHRTGHGAQGSPESQPYQIRVPGQHEP